VTGTWGIPRYAVVPTHNRLPELTTLVRGLVGQCDGILVVDNASTPPLNQNDLYQATANLRDWANFRIIHDPEQPPNLSRLWNVGLDAVAKACATVGVDRWDVAIFNDDAVVPAGWWTVVSDALRSHESAVVACTPAYGPIGAPVLKTQPDGDVGSRMTPWAWVAKGELGQRSDESMRWWWFDTAWDWSARAAGGMLIVPGPTVVNSKANSSTVGVLAEQAGRDRRRFAEIYGGNPW
jgi:hypothetical protein